MDVIGARSVSRFAPRSRLATFSQTFVRSWPLVASASAGGKNEQWNNPEIQELGFNPDGARGPYPLGGRTPQKRRRARGAPSYACRTNAGADRRTGRAIDRARPNRIFERSGKCSERRLSWLHAGARS